MVAVGVGADVVQPHVGLSRLCVGLEEYGLPVATLWTGMILGSGQRWVTHDICYYTCDLVNFVHNLVHVNAGGISQLPRINTLLWD